MNLVNVIIILLLLLGFVVGFKRGFIKQTILSVGTVVLFVMSFKLKGVISPILYNYLPFIKLEGFFKNSSVINIVIYELIAFAIMLSILMIVFKLVLLIGNILDKAVKFTIILGIPSKVLGGVMGFIETYVIIYIVLIILMLPTFNIKQLNNSSIATKIINQTPVVSKYTKPITNSMTEINNLREIYKTGNNEKVINEEMLKILLENKIISKKQALKLYDDKKLNIDNAKTIINESGVE